MASNGFSFKMVICEYRIGGREVGRWIVDWAGRMRKIFKQLKKMQI
jgi:hypothetical protein